MMKKISCFIFVLIALTGCATVKMPEIQHFIEAEDIKKAEQGQSTVVFYRTKKFAGGGVKYHIKDGDHVIGALKSGCYFRYITAPGQHYFWAENEKISSVVIDCLPSKTHYVEGNVSMGMWLGNPELVIVPESVAKPRLIDLQYYDFDFTRKAPIEESEKNRGELNRLF